MYDVAALGELLIDFAQTGIDSDGYPSLSAHPGGAPANFLATIARYGGKTALIGKVGDDTFGNLLLSTLSRSGIDISGMRKTSDYFTTLAFVTFDSHGDRRFAFSRKPGADTQLSFEEIDLSIIDSARVFHFGTLSLTHEKSCDATYRCVDYAKECGKLITFDPNLRKPLWDDLDGARSRMLWGLSKADIVKISDDEVDFLFGLSPLDGARKLLDEYGIKLVFVTCGSEGCIFKNAAAEGIIPAMTGLNVVDTTGAGDIFGGSAVWKVLESGKKPEDLDFSELSGITKFACTAAGLSTEKSGGISSIPSIDMVMSNL